MNKNIIIIVLAVLFILGLLYAFVKADEAEKSRVEAEAQMNLGIELQKQLDALKQNALEAATEAKRQEALALSYADQLAKCQSE